ncbi:hypothetical protein GGI22_004985, partial [Coemansia erecta]
TIPELNEFLQLVQLPETFRDHLCLAMALDFALAYLVERACSAVFADYSAKPIAQHNEIEKTVQIQNYEKRAVELAETEKRD